MYGAYQVRCADGSVLGPFATAEAATGAAGEWERRNSGRHANVELTPEHEREWAAELERNPGDRLGRQ